MARIIVLDNPLNPSDRIEYDWVGPYCADDGESGFLNRHFPDGFPGTHRTFLNREYLPVEQYDVRLGVGDELILLVTPGGIIAAAAAAIGSAIGAAASAVAASAVLSQVAIGLALTAVSYLLAPKPGSPANSTPVTPASLAQNKGESVYNLSVPTNSNRLGAVIPSAYGRNRIVPDFASTPYSKYIANEQYVYMLMCLGHGDFTIHEVYFADTPVSQLNGNIANYGYFPQAIHNNTFGIIHANSAVYENVYTSPEVADQELKPPEKLSEVLEIVSDTELKRPKEAKIEDILGATIYNSASGTSHLVSSTLLPNDNLEVAAGGLLSTYTTTVRSPGMRIGNTLGATITIETDGYWFSYQYALSTYVGKTVTATINSDFADYVITGTCTGLSLNHIDISITSEISGSRPAPGVWVFQFTVEGTPAAGDSVGFWWHSPATLVGPFAVCPPRETVNYVEVDIIFPQGLHEADENTGDLKDRKVEFSIIIDEIDDDNSLVGTPSIVEHAEHQGRTRTPQRLSYGYPVPNGRYRVSIQRDTPDEDSALFQDKAVAVGLKGFIVDPGIPIYSDTSLITMVARATNGLASDVLNRVSVDCTRTLGVTADAAFTDVLTNTLYGASRPLSEKDGTLTGEFHAVFDFDTTVWEALSTITQSVNGQLLPQGRQFRIKTGDPSITPRMRFVEGQTGGGLIVDGSLVQQYALGNRSENDGIEIEYRDPVLYQPAYVLYPTTAVRPRELKLLGCTDVAIAEARAKRIWLEEQHNRFIWTFKTELDAQALEPGDTIEITPLDGSPVLAVVSEVQSSGRYETNVIAFEYDARVYV